MRPHETKVFTLHVCGVCGIVAGVSDGLRCKCGEPLRSSEVRVKCSPQESEHLALAMHSIVQALAIRGYQVKQETIERCARALDDGGHPTALDTDVGRALMGAADTIRELGDNAPRIKTLLVGEGGGTRQAGMIYHERDPHADYKDALTALERSFVEQFLRHQITDSLPGTLRTMLRTTIDIIDRIAPNVLVQAGLDVADAVKREMKDGEE